MKYLALTLLLALCACRHDEPIPLPEPDHVQDPAVPRPGDDGYNLRGFYLLNEGNMGTNKATIDYLDYASGDYTRNIYAAANPDMPMELGDVGNDLAVYGSRLWAVVNTSNKVEVLRAADARRIGQVDIPNCRSIRFHKGYAYITSYAGPVVIDPEYRQRGFVAKVDTATLAVVARCNVGYQPDGLEITGDSIYVANSGGYMVPNYENTVSVIDIATFTERRRFPVAINLNGILADPRGNLWISSRGDYYDTAAALYCYSPAAGKVLARLPVSAAAMTMRGDTLLAVGASWSYVSMQNTVGTHAVSTTDMRLLGSFITDDTASRLRTPYGVAANPLTGEIYLTDAGNYVTPGWLYCLTPDGRFRWRVRTGDIPAHIAFYATITPSQDQ